MERRSRLAATGDAKHAGQAVNMIPKLLVQRIAPAIVGFLSRTLGQEHQLIWRRHWKLAQHEGVHDTEDRRVGSNAQGQREYDHGGERSEESRGGEECRSRGAADQLKKKMW